MQLSVKILRTIYERKGKVCTLCKQIQRNYETRLYRKNKELSVKSDIISRFNYAYGEK